MLAAAVVNFGWHAGRRPKFGWQRRQTFPVGDSGGVWRLRGLQYSRLGIVVDYSHEVKARC